ncbi:MAG: hypothetical protein ACJ8CB_33810 [Ktedonobacteraceae bacterium]
MADNEKMVNDKDTSTATDSGMVTDRDLGIVGGGTIPGSGTSSGTPPHGTNTDNDTADRDKMTDSGKAANTGNTLDKHAQGNLGGRNPSQPQIPMGDRDPKGGGADRGEPDITDPMTSRDPSKIKQNSPKDKSSEQNS